MRVLVDTHVLVWMSRDATELSQRARVAVKNPANDVLLSVASAWELAIKHGLGKIQLGVPYSVFLRHALGAGSMTLVPITPDHLDHVGSLPLHHRDPFDRLLVAQALVEQVPVVSAEATLDAYGIKRIW